MKLSCSIYSVNQMQYTRIPMQHTLEVRAFLFNAKTDYLPYYKNFSMTLNSDDKVDAILAKIQDANDDLPILVKN